MLEGHHHIRNHLKSSSATVMEKFGTSNVSLFFTLAPSHPSQPWFWKLRLRAGRSDQHALEPLDKLLRHIAVTPPCMLTLAPRRGLVKIRTSRRFPRKHRKKTMGSLRKMLKTYGNPKLCLGKRYLYKLWNSIAFATNWKLTIFFGVNHRPQWTMAPITM